MIFVMLICPVKEQCPSYHEEVKYIDVDVHRMINELSVHIHIQNDVQIKISLNVCEGVRLPYFFIYIFFWIIFFSDKWNDYVLALQKIIIVSYSKKWFVNNQNSREKRRKVYEN